MSTSDAALGSMPEWDLRDLYPGTDSAELKRDLAWAAEEAARIRATYQGKLAALGGDGAALAEAIKSYEKLADVIGRIASYSGLLYYADTSDADRAKFFGDMQTKITAISTELVFFELEMNQIDDAVLDAALKHPTLARYAPWFADLRKEKPYQLEEQLERLFVEKAATSRAAWDRLFNETMAHCASRWRARPSP